MPTSHRRAGAVTTRSLASVEREVDKLADACVVDADEERLLSSVDSLVIVPSGKRTTRTTLRAFACSSRTLTIRS